MTPAAQAPALGQIGPRVWHREDVADLLVLLGTDPARGLPEAEAARRLSVDGPNRLRVAGGGSRLRRIGRQLRDPLVVVLIVAAVVSLLLRERVDAAVILGVVVVNALIGYLQESRAESALAALRAMVSTSTTVRRDGVRRSLPSEHLVRGDVVLLEAGDKVTADLRVVEQSQLAVDESTLTGESLPVRKAPDVLDSDTPLGDRRNMAYAGTLVTAGTATGIVVATGEHTELAEIQRLVATVAPVPTPLTRTLARFSRALTVVILLLALLAFVTGTLRGQPPNEMFTAAVALAVGAIPEGLPAAVTITLAIGVTRMARRRAVVRYLPAVETLGSTTVVCTDKTGTLTQNAMTVTSVRAGGRQHDVDQRDGRPTLRAPDGAPVPAAPGSALWWCLVAGARCSEVGLGERLTGDPTEIALVHSAHAGGVDVRAHAQAWPRRGSLPFSSERQLMATLHEGPGAQRVVLVKGAAERVLDLCDSALDGAGERAPLEREPVLAEVAGLADRGLRVLAMACLPDARGLGELSEEGLHGRLAFAGLQAMWDPPRPAAASSVAACRTAGISVKMITGDHPSTAVSIARDLGLGDESGELRVLTGRELAALPDEELPAAVDATTVFARVSPGQKLDLVQALQARTQVVAMTGDGVNDAPALKQADIGVAMGRSGTEVAKEAADMVLLDDDFATVEAAVEEGRGVFDNLTKFLMWTLPTNLAEGFVVLLAILLGSTLPILPTQLLWINMTTAVLLGLMLAFEPFEEGAMRRPPRSPQAPLLPRPTLERMTLVAAVLLAGTWAGFHWEQAAGGSVTDSRTVALNTLVALQVVYLFGCRSSHRSARQVGFFSNRWLMLGVAAQAVAQVAITYLPPMQSAFSTAGLGTQSWLRLLAIAAVGALVLSLDKAWRSRR